MNPFTYAQVCLALTSHYADTNMNIPRGDYIQSILNLGLHVMSELNITEDTEDLDEIIQDYVYTNKEKLECMS
jgi:hypothetical protein